MVSETILTVPKQPYAIHQEKFRRMETRECLRTQSRGPNTCYTWWLYILISTWVPGSEAEGPCFYPGGLG